VEYVRLERPTRPVADCKECPMSESGSEELKKKFREVLEQKNSKSHNSVDHKDGGPKVNNAHGPADHQKMFRRKSV
jgi:hypothetical protein